MSSTPVRYFNPGGFAFRKVVVAISGATADVPDAPSITAGAGAPSAAAVDGSIYLRTNGTIYVRSGGSWVASEIAAGDFGAGPLLVDTVNESTPAAGVTVDGVLVKDGGIVLADAAVLEVDTVNEATAAAGVTVDGLLIKDGSVRPDVIADPGDAGAIPVDESGTCAITTAGAETRTLAIPTFAGQEIAISMDVDGPGDCVITSAEAFNQTGNNTITLNDAGDFILLVGVTVGGALRWRVAANDGAALSTVP